MIVDHLKSVLAANLLKFRKKSGFTQSELAEAAGLSLGYVQKIEYMAAWPSPESFESISKALKIPPSDLLIDPKTNPVSKADLITGIYSIVPTLDEEELMIALKFLNRTVNSRVIKTKKPLVG